MKKVLFYLLAVILGLWGALSILRALELIFTGSLSAYGAGSVTGSLVLGLLLLLGAWKVVGLARRTNHIGNDE